MSFERSLAEYGLTLQKFKVNVEQFNMVTF